MSLPSSFAFIFAQASTAAAGDAGTPAGSAAVDPSQQGPPAMLNFFIFALLLGMVYFALIRPQSVAKKKQEDTIKGAKTGDKIVTTGGIHGVITNVKDTTVIVKVADNVKLEIEKNHLDKIIRADTAEPEKAVATKS
jgi:preprotein translocase subunit YajC